MKKIARLALVACALSVASTNLFAQENSFGVRASTFRFPESMVFTDSVFVIREVADLSYRRAFEPEQFSGTAWEVYYTWRRDTDAHFELEISGGWFGKNVTTQVPGTAFVEDNRGTSTVIRSVPATVANSLDYTLYYVNVTPVYNFTTGKFRFYLGAGIGLWANLWREVWDATYPDIFSCQIVGGQIDYSTCTENSNLREGQGNRRTIVPFTVNAGFTYNFLPHWSFNIENRYVFKADSSVNLFRQDSTFDVTQNQIVIGFAYKL